MPKEKRVKLSEIPCPECKAKGMYLELYESDHGAILVKEDNKEATWESDRAEINESQVVCGGCGYITTDFGELIDHYMEANKCQKKNG